MGKTTEEKCKCKAGGRQTLHCTYTANTLTAVTAARDAHTAARGAQTRLVAEHLLPGHSQEVGGHSPPER